MFIFIAYNVHTKIYSFNQSKEKDSFILLKSLRKLSDNIELKKVYLTDKEYDLTLFESDDYQKIKHYIRKILNIQKDKHTDTDVDYTVLRYDNDKEYKLVFDKKTNYITISTSVDNKNIGFLDVYYYKNTEVSDYELLCDLILDDYIDSTDQEYKIVFRSELILYSSRHCSESFNEKRNMMFGYAKYLNGLITDFRSTGYNITYLSELDPKQKNYFYSNYNNEGRINCTYSIYFVELNVYETLNYCGGKKNGLFVSNGRKTRCFKDDVEINIDQPFIKNAYRGQNLVNGKFYQENLKFDAVTCETFIHFLLSRYINSSGKLYAHVNIDKSYEDYVEYLKELDIIHNLADHKLIQSNDIFSRYIKEFPKVRVNSKGEKLIYNYLIKEKIPFKCHYRPDFLKNSETGKNLEYDFFLTIGDKKIAIEYNGKQHYEFVKFFHKNEDDFRKQQERDKLKEKLSIDNNIKLITIKYDMDINSVLSSNLK